MLSGCGNVKPPSNAPFDLHNHETPSPNVTSAPAETLWDCSQFMQLVYRYVFYVSLECLDDIRQKWPYRLGSLLPAHQTDLYLKNSRQIRIWVVSSNLQSRRFPITLPPPNCLVVVCILFWLPGNFRYIWLKALWLLCKPISSYVFSL